MEVVKENQQLHMVGSICLYTVTPNTNINIKILLTCLYIVVLPVGEFVSLKRLLIS